jgi:hypothetical protein
VGSGDSAGLDQLQHLRAEATGAALAIKGLKNQARCRGQISRLRTLAGLPIKILSPVQQTAAV